MTNTGSITLQRVTVTDTRAGQVTCGTTTLVPGDSTRCTSTKAYVISTADAKAGAVHNVATATASCGCKAEVKAVKAAAVVATKRAASDRRRAATRPTLAATRRPSCPGCPTPERWASPGRSVVV